MKKFILTLYKNGKKFQEIPRHGFGQLGCYLSICKEFERFPLHESIDDWTMQESK